MSSPEKRLCDGEYLSRWGERAPLALVKGQTAVEESANPSGGENRLGRQQPNQDGDRKVLSDDGIQGTTAGVRDA